MSRWRPVLALAAALLVGGCGGLQDSGPVEPGLEVGSGQQANLGIVFPGPGQGESQENIVSGFLRAGAASNGDYENARKFLTVQAAESWNPDETLVLRSDDKAPTTNLVDSNHVEATAAVAGTVDADGRYTPAEPGSTVTQSFALTEVSGEWRISALPEHFGRWIASRDVSRLVQPFSIHYISTSQRATVPDVRWFPLDKLYTRLARAQLDPVPDYLEGAATTAVPQGARLLGDAVSLDNTGLATVNLVGARLEPGATTRQDLWAQFITTLNQDPSVSRISLSVDSTPVDLLGLTAPATSLADIGFPARPNIPAIPPVVRRGSELRVFDPTGTAQQTTTPLGTAGYPRIPADYTHLAMSADGAEVAAVDPTGDGISRWRGTTRYEVPRFGSAVGSPSYDQRGYLWVGGVGNGADRLFVVDASEDPANPQVSAATPVEAGWLAGRRVLESRVAVDGDRIAVLSTTIAGGDPRVDLAGIIRDSEGRPERLAAPLRLGVTVRDATGLTWVDDTDVATIAAVGGESRRPTVLSVGGDVRPLADAPGATGIVSTGGELNLYVLTADGRLLSRTGGRWTESGAANDLMVPAG